MAYVTVADVESRCTGLLTAINPTNKVFSTTTIPTLAQVGLFITDAENTLNAYLEAINISTPLATNSKGALAAKIPILDYVVGMVYSNYSRSGGDDGDIDGEDMIKRYYDHLKAIERNPQHYRKVYSSATSPVTGHYFTEDIPDPMYTLTNTKKDF
ncbi:MAG: hypothetical protein HC877_20695 [Thioploca sp.]|nr:hypothetical protein [Thioploca sp.]